MSYLSTSHGIFIISFNGVCNQYIFNTSNPDTLGDLIKNKGKYGVVFIKRLEPMKGVFKKLSKKEVINLFSWDTYAIEELKKINYIK